MKIYLVRHGESMGNIDKNVHHTTADHAISLSDNGKKQAFSAGLFLKNELKENCRGEKVRIWTSPYRRTRQTSKQIMKALGLKWNDYLDGTKPRMPSLQSKMSFKDIDISYREHTLLCEQQFGLFDGLEDDELQIKYPNEGAHYQKCMDQEGRFWARMPLGESRFDVATRVHQAFGTFHRDCEKHNIKNIIVVCHGVTLRAFVMQWLHYTPEWFDKEKNPSNCAIRGIDGNKDLGYLFKP